MSFFEGGLPAARLSTNRGTQMRDKQGHVKLIVLLRKKCRITPSALFRMGALLALFFVTSIYGRLPPEYDWKTVETEHFRIHFPGHLVKTGKRLAVIAEAAHREMVPRLNWKPFLKTEVVLTDHTDYSNGYAGVFPRNTITLFMKAPPPDSELGHTDDWLGLVLRHEYLHILHLDTAYGPWGVSRYLLGRNLLGFVPGVTTPTWFTEGLGTYTESRLSHEQRWGRGHSSLAKMIVRSEFLRPGLPEMAHGYSYDLKRVPRGSYPYLMGEDFLRYVEDKYGDGVLARYIENYADNWVPWFMDYAARQTFGRNFSDIWEDWARQEKEKYQREFAELKTAGLTRLRFLTPGDGRASHLRFSPDGERLYFFLNTARDQGRLSWIPSKGIGGKAATGYRETDRVMNPAGLTFLGNGQRILYSDLTVVNHFRQYNRLFASTPLSGRERETEMRAPRRVLSLDSRQTGDGHWLAMVVTLGGYQYLFLERFSDRRSLNAFLESTDEWQQRIRPEKSVVTGIPPRQARFGQLRFSPDARDLVFSLRRDGSFSDLYRLDVNNRKVTRLTRDGFTELHPAFDSEGRYLYFSADYRQGIYNIYRAPWGKPGPLAGAEQLTRTAGGFFYPALRPQTNQLLAIHYDHRGDRVVALSDKVAPLGEEPVRLEFQPEPEPTPVNSGPESGKPAGGAYTVRDYSPWPTILPVYWSPAGATSQYDSEGGAQFLVTTAAVDSLDRHQWQAQYGYTSLTGQHSLNAAYAYGGWRSLIFAGYSGTLNRGDPTEALEQVVGYGDDSAALLLRRYQEFQLGAQLPFNFRWRSVSLGGQYIFERQDLEFWQAAYIRKTGTEAAVDQPEFFASLARHGVGLSFVHDSSRAYVYSVSREDGWRYSAALRAFPVEGGSPANDVFTEQKLKLFLPWPDWWGKNQVLYLAAFHFFNRNASGLSLNDSGYTAGGPPSAEDLFAVDENAIRGVNSLLAGRGRQKILLRVEYRWPLAQTDWGISSLPWLFRDLYLVPFADSGVLFDETVPTPELWHSGFGVEIISRQTALTPGGSFEILLGYAYGPGAAGQKSVYLGLRASL